MHLLRSTLILPRAACLRIMLGLTLVAGGGTSTASGEPGPIHRQAGPASPVLSADAELISAHYGQASGCTTTVTAGPGGDAWVPLVQQGLAWLCGQAGPLAATVQVSVGVNSQGGAWPFAEAVPVGTASGSLSCPVTIETLTGVSDSNARMATITHELWHCYQAQIMGVGAWTNAVHGHPLNVNGASWLIEGSAEWVGECSVGDCTTQGSFISGKWWDQYLSTPQTPLFERGYDAIGFYAHMQESGISPFERLPAMLTAGSDASAFAAAQVNETFLETWAGGYARQRPWDPGLWDTTGPGITATAPSLSSTAMNNGASVTDDIQAYSNDIGAYALTADVVTISVGFDGHAELHTADGATLDSAALSGSFCMLPAGCALPSSCSYTGPALGTLAAGDAVLAVNGGTSGARVTIAGLSVEAFCQLQPVPAPPAGAKTGACTVSKETTPTGGGPVVVSSEPCLILLAVEGNALIEVNAHPSDVATALLNMATQNAGTAPTSCEQVSVGPPVPFYSALPQAPPALTSLDGFVGYVACLYRPVPNDGFPASGVLVAWFSSASQAEQAYAAAAAQLP